MDSYPDDENPPSYEQTYGSAEQQQQQGPNDFERKKSTKSPSSQGPILPAQLDAVREQRIHILTSTYIQPLITEQGLSGLYKTIIVLIPSNIAGLNEPDVVVEQQADNMIHGLPAEEHVKIVRLKGEENRMEFWRQPVVLDQLGRELRSRLQAAGHHLHSSTTGESTLASSIPTTARSSGWSNVFRRMISNKEDVLEPIPGMTGSGWKAEEKKSSRRIGPGEVSVEVDVRTICMRVLTSFGLWETRTGDAISVTIEVGS